jgi:predicted dehydrogenase
VRISLGLVQNDINVLWDLGPHDLSIMNYLCEREPVSVSAIGTRHLGCPFENMAYMSVHFRDNLIAHFHLNWLAPVKVRRTLVGGSKKMIVYDDMEPTEKIKVYDKGISMNYDPQDRARLLAGYRNGDMLVPNLDTGEALRLMASDFIRTIVEGGKPLSDGFSGYRVVRLLQLAQQSMALNGRLMEVDPLSMVVSERVNGPQPAAPLQSNHLRPTCIEGIELSRTETELSTAQRA